MKMKQRQRNHLKMLAGGRRREGGNRRREESYGGENVAAWRRPAWRRRGVKTIISASNGAGGMVIRKCRHQAGDGGVVATGRLMWRASVAAPAAAVGIEREEGGVGGKNYGETWPRHRMRWRRNVAGVAGGVGD